MDFVKLGADAVKGAAGGSFVPGVGSALGAAGSVALDLAPELGKWLFGSNSAQTVQAVQTAIEVATGTTESGAQVSALTNPDVATELRVRLASIVAEQSAAEAKAQQEALAAQLADIAGARANTLQLAEASSPMAWGAAIISTIVLITFGGTMALALMRSLPPNAEPVLNVLLGTLGAMATSVVSYWVGSSAGSARKDARLATMLKN